MILTLEKIFAAILSTAFLLVQENCSGVPGLGPLNEVFISF
jgi:hypothetical protein